MKKIVSIIIALLIMVPFIACARGELSGTYANPKNSSAYLVFDEKRVTVHLPNNTTYSGTYEIYKNASVTWPYNIDLHLENKAGREVVLNMQLSADGKVLYALFEGGGVYVKK